MTSNTGGILAIQYNWEENIRRKENIWVYYKYLDEPSHHGHIVDGSFQIITEANRSILIKYNSSGSKVLFVCPFATFSDIHKKSIISVDVAEGGLAVSASVDNKLLVWETKTGSVRRVLEGHVFDVYCCQMFPSGVVCLSGGSDMQIRVWDAKTGDCPVVLKGHSASVNSTAIIDRGKNIVSVSKDGTVRLWNCAQSKCLAVFAEIECPVNCCDVIDAELSRNRPADLDEVTDELEFGTEGKVLAFGCDDGKLYLYNMYERQILAIHFLTSSVLCLCWLPSRHLIIGTGDGKIMMLEVSNMNLMPLCISHDSLSEVLCVKPLFDGFIIGRRNGLCQIYDKNGKSTVQLTGPDCDPVYGVATDSQYIYTTCRDGVIRKYKIDDINFQA